MDRDACQRILQEYAELRGPFDEAMVLLAEAVRAVHEVARDVGEEAALADVADRLERAASLLEAARTLLEPSGDGPSSRLSQYVARQRSLVTDLLAATR